jgi:hypothetical protein
MSIKPKRDPRRGQNVDFSNIGIKPLIHLRLKDGVMGLTNHIPFKVHAIEHEDRFEGHLPNKTRIITWQKIAFEKLDFSHKIDLKDILEALDT